MGVELNKCLCIYDNKDENAISYLKTEQFDIPSQNNLPQLSINDYSQKKSFKYFNNSLTSYSTHLKEAGMYSSSEEHGLIKQIHSITTLDSNFLYALSTYPVQSVIRLQKIFRGKCYKRKYDLQLKTKLQLDRERTIKKLKEKYKVKPMNNNDSTEFTLFEYNDINQYKNNLNAFGLRFKNQCIELKGSNEGLYMGETNINNKPYGIGVMYTKDESKFEGYWNNNLFTCRGRKTDKEGNVYEGYFTNKLLNGKGIRLSSTGSKYIGDFRLSKREGKGREESHEHIYEGQYGNDMKNGKGKLMYKLLNDCYEGDFIDNNLTGIGKYTWSNKDTYEGSFVNGTMEGKGTYIFADTSKYTGEYSNNIKEGNGHFTWPDGKIFEGQFHNGVPHGNGVLKIKGKEIEVIFKQGKIISNIRELMLR